MKQAIQQEILESLRDLACLQAGIIQKMSAAYGSPDTWRHDFTQAVKIMERMSVLVHTNPADANGQP